MAPTGTPNAAGSQKATYEGTGPAGATTGAGPVTTTPEMPIEPASDAITHDKGKVRLEGSAFKSVVCLEVNNNGSLSFKGKSSNTNNEANNEANSNTQERTSNPTEHSAGTTPADITVAEDVKMSVVTIKMTTVGISFVDDNE